MDRLTYLESQLSNRDPAARAAALTELATWLDAGGIELAPGTDAVNMHCHSFFSFNAYGHSPTALAWLGKRLGLGAIGIVDFDVLDGVDEFLDACDALGQRGSAGIETRVFIPEYADREINSPGEPGVCYHMGIGFTSCHVPAAVAPILAELSEGAGRRNRDVVARVNDYLAPVTVDYDRDVVPLTPAGHPTERHIVVAYIRAADQPLAEPAPFWAGRLAVPSGEVAVVMADSPRFQNLIRSKLIRRGGPGYVQPESGMFPSLDAFHELIVACGALPCAAWLDGTSAAEQDPEAWLEFMIGQGVVALNIVPDRNWNIADTNVREQKVRNLYRVVKAAQALDLPLNVGTEMNSFGQKLVDDFDAPELAPVRQAFIDGAFFVYGHTVMQRALGYGYQSAWARSHLPTRRERNEFYTRIGYQVAPGQDGLAQLRQTWRLVSSSRETETVSEKSVPDKLTEYQDCAAPLPATNHLWPLYGAGFENFGRDGQLIDVPMPAYGADELLVRHDAVGLCFSDIKLIRQGEDHPRIYRDMRANPVVQGHEVCMTVAGVGEELRDQYQVGDRFIIQSDVFVDGVGYAYGYEIQGGLSEYGVIDQRILNGDHGNYLIPVQPETGYAESALTEPWACVIAAYQLAYRTALKGGGTAWIVGTGDRGAVDEEPGVEDDYTISEGLDERGHPARLMLTNVPRAFEAWLRARAEALGVEVIDVPDVADPPVTPVDDVVLLGADPGVIEAVMPYLGHFGVVALVDDVPMTRKVAVDVGRVHYDRWVVVGGPGPDIVRAYSDLPVRSTLKPGGRAWFVGAGGPMGRMHVQRAIELAEGPGTMVCTDVSDLRLDDLCASFGAEAEAKGIEWICLNPMHTESYAATMARFREEAFEDIVVLAPVPRVIADAAAYLAPGGVMNVFAGVARGTMVDLDLSGAYLKGTRVIGHSASTIDDLRLMLSQAESGELSPNRSVAAIGSLSAARNGMIAVQEAVYPGKIVIYPHIKEMPLTTMAELEYTLPTVYARLKEGREWTVEAEREFLRLMLR